MTDDLSDDLSAASPAREGWHTSQAAPHTTHFTPPTTSRTTHNLTTHNAQLQAQRGAEKLFSTGVESLPSLEAGVERLHSPRTRRGGEDLPLHACLHVRALRFYL